MKPLSTLTIAALLCAGAAFASTAPTATPAPAATPATASSVAKPETHCTAQAKEKKLTGDDAKKFIKECKEAKKTN